MSSEGQKFGPANAANVAAMQARIAALEARLAEAERALRLVADKQQHALKIIEDNGFVFDDIGKEPGNWKHLAFTLYSEICEIDIWARAALDIPLGEPAALPPESGTPTTKGTQ